MAIENEEINLEMEVDEEQIICSLIGSYIEKNRSKELSLNSIQSLVKIDSEQFGLVQGQPYQPMLFNEDSWIKYEVILSDKNITVHPFYRDNVYVFIEFRNNGKNIINRSFAFKRVNI